MFEYYVIKCSCGKLEGWYCGMINGVLPYISTEIGDATLFSKQNMSEFYEVLKATNGVGYNVKISIGHAIA